MLSRMPGNLLNDPEGNRDSNGLAPSASQQHRTPSPGPDEPQNPANGPPPTLPPPDAAYAHESAHHYHQQAMAAALGQQHHVGLPPLDLPFPPPHHGMPPMDPHIHPGIYQPAPQVNPGTRPQRQTRTRGSSNKRGEGDGEERRGSDLGSDGDDSDEYVPEAGETNEGVRRKNGGGGHRRGANRRSRGGNDGGDEHEDDDHSAGEAGGRGGSLPRLPSPAHFPPQHHLPHPHHTHPHPQGMPQLPPDPHYALSASHSLATLSGSQSQTQNTQESFGMGPIDPLTGIPMGGGDGSGGESQTGGGGGTTPRGKRGRKHQNDEEWNRQRKDNHKEVERRRRGNINEGISQLAAIVPNATGGEKAKGAILTRAVQYIHQLKDNEARNIEKWTLEKLLMDQAMGDLQGQLEDMKRRWEVEAQARMTVERELEMYKSSRSGAADGEVGQKRPRID